MRQVHGKDIRTCFDLGGQKLEKMFCSYHQGQKWSKITNAGSKKKKKFEGMDITESLQRLREDVTRDTREVLAKERRIMEEIRMVERKLTTNNDSKWGGNVF